MLCAVWNSNGTTRAIAPIVDAAANGSPLPPPRLGSGGGVVTHFCCVFCVSFIYRTNTTELGGCTIWFDELGMLSECEKRIAKPIDRLDQKELLRGKEKIVQMQQKLRKAGTAEDQEVARHVAIVLPVAEVSRPLLSLSRSACV